MIQNRSGLLSRDVLLTAKGSMEDTSIGMSKGADGYIVKSFTASNLIDFDGVLIAKHNKTKKTEFGFFFEREKWNNIIILMIPQYYR